MPYIVCVIQSFRNKALQRLFETGNARGLSVRDDRRVTRILVVLDDAIRPEDLYLPGFHFHTLVGTRQGRYSVLMTGNWRITFGWDGENAIEVDLEDYH